MAVIKSLASRWRILVLGLGCNLVCSTAYRVLQHVEIFPTRISTTCASWDWTPFSTLWLGPYMLLFPLMAWVWFVLPDMKAALRFARALLGSAFVGWIGFTVFPHACARPPALEGQWAYQLLHQLDAPNNCLPCLHAAFAILCAATINTHLASRRPFWAVTAWCAVAAIFPAIVGLRQHTGIDVAAGSVLGLFATAYYLRRKATPAPAHRETSASDSPSPVCPTETASHNLSPDHER